MEEKLATLYTAGFTIIIVFIIAWILMEKYYKKPEYNVTETIKNEHEK